jgi:deazaflavin-dependent oxidoreductase (nitroreductase family)
VTDVNDHNRKIIDEYRASSGKLGGFFEGKPVLLLHTTGARTGKGRVNPTMYLVDGDRLAVFATKSGAPTNPGWYHNVLANPEVTAEVGAETRHFHAHVATGDERDRIWTRQKLEQPGFADYETQTDRVIPVVILEPVNA